MFYDQYISTKIRTKENRRQHTYKEKQKIKMHNNNIMNKDTQKEKKERRNVAQYTYATVDSFMFSIMSKRSFKLNTFIIQFLSSFCSPVALSMMSKTDNVTLFFYRGKKYSKDKRQQQEENIYMYKQNR